MAVIGLLAASACTLLPQSAGGPEHSAYDPALLNESFQHEGVFRQAMFYIPFPLRPEGVPVVFVLHDSGATAKRMMEATTEERWNELAFREKFIVVYPQGWKRYWNDCRGDMADPQTGQDDVGYLLYLLEWLDAEYPVDRGQIYAAGHGEGGMMVLRLAAEAPETFKAVFSANGPQAAQPDCSAAQEPVSVAYLAGTQNPLIPFEGGAVGLSGENLGTVLSAEATLQSWLEINNIDTSPEVTEFRDRVSDDGSTATCWAYEGTAARVWFIRVEGGGHAWPGESPFTRIEAQTNGYKNLDINAADLAWAFFQGENP